MNEPHQLYIGFDNSFFTDNKPVHGNLTRKDCTRRYRELIEQHSQDIDQVLQNKASPEDLPETFFVEINKLSEYEQGVSTSFLAKMYDIGKVMDEWKIENIPDHQRYFFWGKTPFHLTRLIKPYTYASHAPENAKFNFNKQFGEDYLNWVKQLPEEEERGYNFSELVGGEGGGVATYWSIIPYVYADLRQREQSRNEAMNTIVNWILDSEDDGIFNPKFASFGFADIYRFDIGLGYDERMPSHLRSRILSKVVTQRLVE
jgi:hypothetical protein